MYLRALPVAFVSLWTVCTEATAIHIYICTSELSGLLDLAVIKYPHKDCYSKNPRRNHI